LHNFQNVSAIFSSFGDIMESCNKLHPETGVCLGFATFRYRDSKMIKGARFISAIEAAKTAVRKGPTLQIGRNKVSVWFDPEGNKSRRMMEERILAVSKPNPMSQTAKSATSATKPTEAVKTSGPPPTAPKGPSGNKPIFRPTIPAFIPPTKPKSQRSLDGPLLAAQFPHTPYLWVDGETVPVMPTTPPHMFKRVKHFDAEEVLFDRTGYYIIFPNTHWGRTNCERCHISLNGSLMFNYTMSITMFPYGSAKESQNVASRTIDSSRKRERSPTRKELEEREKQKERDRERAEALVRKREEENDLEEEKKERAKNFDPCTEAIEAIRRELKDQLLKNIRT
jgi:histone-lysine N-methyltransferase SETD1